MLADRQGLFPFQEVGVALVKEVGLLVEVFFLLLQPFFEGLQVTTLLAAFLLELLLQLLFCLVNRVLCLYRRFHGHDFRLALGVLDHLGGKRLRVSHQRIGRSLTQQVADHIAGACCDKDQYYGYRNVNAHCCSPSRIFLLTRTTRSSVTIRSIVTSCGSPTISLAN